MFEYDSAKSAANLAKHGIDFERAQAIWADEMALRIDARSNDEPRFAVIGMAQGRLWTAFATMRGDAIRLISVRRSRPDEANSYELQ